MAKAYVMYALRAPVPRAPPTATSLTISVRRFGMNATITAVITGNRTVTVSTGKPGPEAAAPVVAATGNMTGT